ncbi:MAG TPA: iron-sulfur cluster repair di-iron protein [Atopostipes sp.]|nr:iron-sulfur cluster repair di-iron protein [Atopostipes sp.]
MSQLTIDTQVADIVNTFPESMDLFQELRIDFCCGGKIPLKEAAEKQNIAPEDVLSRINDIEEIEGKQGSFDPMAFGNKTLVAYIQETYHEPLEKELTDLRDYISTIVRVHGDSHPHLFNVEKVFAELSTDLLEHTIVEDTNDFPIILEFLKHPDNEELKEKATPCVANLEEDHAHAGELLFEIRDLTNNYTPPENACNTYKLVYRRLEQLEKNTFTHVHLENNILFKRVLNAM